VFPPDLAGEELETLQAFLAAWRRELVAVGRGDRFEGVEAALVDELEEARRVSERHSIRLGTSVVVVCAARDLVGER